MALPILEPAPVVTEDAAVFRDLCDHPCPCRHCQHDLTGVSVLPNTSLATRARGIFDRADPTNRSRVLAEAPW